MTKFINHHPRARVTRGTPTTLNKQVTACIVLHRGMSRPTWTHGRILNIQTHELKAGDCVYVARSMPRGVETMEDTRVRDMFRPPRAEYLAIDERMRAEGKG